ncbi:hypothetical protein DSO57_1008990 [Entomophthora muscae]|uniref:Uncharacterized protein n=1 Tax=Entomophthora muscae TaxID=34485 RepID=A0ACC2TI33_9FUNG|nr:hypothetical protein DSO57_1008990 [Entomophthora muscae]
MPKHKSASYSESDAKLQEIFLHIRKSLTITNVCSNNLIEHQKKKPLPSPQKNRKVNW